MILIKNGLVKTMVGEDIENGQILIDGKKIVAVGKEVNAPADVEVIDAAGCIVTPGLIDGHCHVGMMEEGIGFEGNDVNEITDPITAQLRAIDAINPMDESFANAVAAGVTTSVTGPGSANVVGGTFLAMKNVGKRIDDMIIKNPVAMKCAFGENPKRCYNGKGRSPSTRMATAATLRTFLAKSQRYMEELEEAEKNGTKKPAFDPQLEAMLPVMRKEIPLKAHAH
ncbi:MAG: amidohydrolase, partial [Clostridia bacterium]|nr:amidohydrolase [Clostridia bacterium]